MGLKDRDYYWEHIRKLEEEAERKRRGEPNNPPLKEINKLLTGNKVSSNSWDWIIVACIIIASQFRNGDKWNLLKKSWINPEMVIFCSFLIATLCIPKTSAWDKKLKGYNGVFRAVFRWVFSVTIIVMLIVSTKSLMITLRS